MTTGTPTAPVNNVAAPAAAATPNQVTENVVAPEVTAQTAAPANIAHTVSEVAPQAAAPSTVAPVKIPEKNVTLTKGALEKIIQNAIVTYEAQQAAKAASKGSENIAKTLAAEAVKNQTVEKAATDIMPKTPQEIIEGATPHTPHVDKVAAQAAAPTTPQVRA